MIYRVIPARWRAPIGWWLRCLADDIDYDHGPRITGWSFTFERGRGVVFHHGLGGRNPGCPIWLMDEDYNRAHTEAENPLFAQPAAELGPDEKKLLILTMTARTSASGFVWVCPNCAAEVAEVTAGAFSSFLDQIAAHCHRDCPAPGRMVSGSFSFGGRTFRLGR